MSTLWGGEEEKKEKGEEKGKEGGGKMEGGRREDGGREKGRWREGEGKMEGGRREDGGREEGGEEGGESVCVRGGGRGRREIQLVLTRTWLSQVQMGGLTLNSLATSDVCLAYTPLRELGTPSPDWEERGENCGE